MHALVHLDSTEAVENATSTGWWGFRPAAVAASADGSTVVWGESALETDRMYTGAAYVFTKREGSWPDTGPEDVTVLLPPEHPDWKALEPRDYVDISMSFGGTIAVSGDGGVVVVGAPDHRPPGPNTGAVYVFIRPEDGWDEGPEVITLLPPPSEDSVGFGDSVAVSADGRVIVAGFDISFYRTSLAYVFTRPTSGWSETPAIAKLTTVDPLPAYGGGSSLSISPDGSTVVFASPESDARVASYVFLRPGPEWADTSDAARLMAGDLGPDDLFGLSISVSYYGDTVLVLASGEGPYGEDHGAVYVFTRPETGWTDAVETAVLTASDGVLGVSVAVSPGGDRAIVGTAEFLNPSGTAGIYLFAREGPVWKDMSKSALTWDTAMEEEQDLFGLGAFVALGDGIVVLGGVAANAVVLAPSSNDLSSEWFGADPTPPRPAARPTEQSPELLWRYDASRMVWGTTVSQGKVYARSDNLDSELFALDAVTGELLWKNEDTNHHNYNPFSQPVAAQDRVYVLSQNWRVYSVDGATGTRGSSYRRGENRAVTTPALADGILYAASSGGLMLAFEADSGELLWSSQIGRVSDYSAAIVSDGALYVALEDGSVRAIDVGAGDALWQFEVEGATLHSPVVDEGMVYIAADVSPLQPRPPRTHPALGSGGRIYAVDAATGELAWVHEASSRAGAPSVADGTVYFASGDGRVYALRASNGQRLWDYETVFLGFAPPTVADGVVYAGSGRRVNAIEAATGELVWSYRLGGDIWPSPPAVADGVVYVGATDGYVYALTMLGAE